MSRIIRPETAFSVAGRTKTKAKVKHKSIQQCDSIFSKCIRERSDWTCQRCGTVYERGSQGLHCSHLWSRRLRSGRFCPLNVVSHCFPCHQFLGGNPHTFSAWIEDYLGDRFEEWLQLPHEVLKLRPVDRDQIFHHYTQAQAEQLRLRDQGITGWLPVGDWR